MQSAQEQAQALFKEKYPEEKHAIIACGAGNNKDGTFTAYVHMTAEQGDPSFDPSLINKYDFKSMRVGEVRDRLRANISPTLEKNGFKYLKSKGCFKNGKIDGQTHEVFVLCSWGITFSISARLHLADVVQFYKGFDPDPRELGPFPAHSQYLRDYDLFGHSFPGCPPYPPDQFESAAPVIVAAIMEKVLPWFDNHATLTSVRDALEQSCNTSVKHETLLPLYFLLEEQDGLEKYLTWLFGKNSNLMGSHGNKILFPFTNRSGPNILKFFLPLNEIRSGDAK